MDLFSDKFISYNDTFDVKLEKSSDYEKPLNSTSSLHTCESPLDLYANAFPAKFQHLLNPQAPLTINSHFERKNGVKKHKPFRIIKAKKDDMQPLVEVKIESEEKLSMKSKLIMKREKARQRAKTKQELAPVTKIEADPTVDEFEKSDGPDETNKKVLQMIRNRISAQNSRDKKKAYVYQLEETKQKLYTDMLRLRQEKDFMLEEVDKLREQNAKLFEKNRQLKTGMPLDSENLEEKDHTSELNGPLGISPNQSMEEIRQKVINMSDPMTSNFVSQNKELFNSTFSFAMCFSMMLTSQVNQKKTMAPENQIQASQQGLTLPKESQVEKLVSEDEQENNINNNNFLHNGDEFVDFCMNDDHDQGQSGLEFRNSAQMYNNLHDDCIPKSPFIKFEDNQDNQDLRHGLFFGEESKESKTGTKGSKKLM